MLEYVVNESRFTLSYQDLKDTHYRMCQLSDEDFLHELAAATHLACVICWLKEIPSDACLCDHGIIHELIHLWHIPEGNTTNIQEIRNQFAEVLKLV